MIIGIGTDLVEINRIQRILARPEGQRFLNKILTPEELELAAARGPRLAEFAAGRFAAKEAVSKAVGCGLGGKLGFHDIAVLPDTAGRPECALSQASLARLGLSSVRVHISITHTSAHAMAYALAEQI